MPSQSTAPLPEPQPLPTNPKFQNQIGKTFGRLTVVAYVGKSARYGHSLWLCHCICNNKTVAQTQQLKNGQKQSCGCLMRQRCGERGAKHFFRHGQFRTPEYRAWIDMKSRCNKQNHKSFHNYGGRGIRVCERWYSFENFYADMGPRPSPQHSLDRFPDKNGDYEPSNVRWATRAEQLRNKRTNVMLTFDGKTMCVADWARQIGMSKDGLSARLKKWSVDKSLTEPKIPRGDRFKALNEERRRRHGIQKEAT